MSSAPFGDQRETPCEEADGHGAPALSPETMRLKSLRPWTSQLPSSDNPTSANLSDFAREGDSRDEKDQCGDTDVAQNEARDSHPAPSLSPIRLLDLVERDMPEDHGKD